MFSIVTRKQGFSLIEAMIAMFVTLVAVMAIFSLIAPSWRTAAKSDGVGRAAHILYDQLQREEIQILNRCNTVAAGARDCITVYASGNDEEEGARTGDIPYTVRTTITAIPPASGGPTDTWEIRVRVTWPGSTADGIEDVLIVQRQENFRFGCT